MKNNLCVIPYWPYKDFKLPPPDVSECTLDFCPHCNERVWISKKKKEIFKIASLSKRDIFRGCYTCVENYFKEMKNTGELGDKTSMAVLKL